MNTLRHCGRYAALLLVLAGVPVCARAQQPPEPAADVAAATTTAAPAPPPAASPPASPLYEELRSGFYSRLNVMAFGVYNDLDASQQQLNFLGLARSQTEIDFRPDFSLNFRNLDLGLKPRLLYARSSLDDGFFSAGGRSENRHHGYINEGYLRYRISDKLTAIYGRENLQWGPAALLSSSNPFNANNGKGNPNVELPGLDYVRLVMVPSAAWTVSLIANTGAGRFGRDDQLFPAIWTVFPGIPGLVGPVDLDFSALLGQPFKKTYAAKIDYTGEGYYWSLIASRREQGPNRIGAFGGWNASDALLLYAEGSSEQGGREPWSQERAHRLLLGGSYTLEGGQTVSAEYFHNNAGCTVTPVLLCALTPPAPPRLPLQRRRYALLQYVDTKIHGNVNLVARLVGNLDDHSSLASVNLEWELGEHWQLYVAPTVASGDSGSEFGTLPRRSLFVGLTYTY